MTVRNGLSAARIIAANADFSAQLYAIYSKRYSDCGSEGRGSSRASRLVEVKARSPPQCRGILFIDNLMTFSLGSSIIYV
jgi:hypothetical protein